jgi:hypothetical protein
MVKKLWNSGGGIVIFAPFLVRARFLSLALGYY